MSELSPTQVALRELMILTRCYCDGEHPRLGHNCSFRRDVQTVVTAVQKVLALVGDGRGDGVWEGFVEAEKVRALLLGVPERTWPPDDPPWREDEPFYPCEHGGTRGTDYCRLCEQVAPGDNGNATPDVSDGEGSASGPG